MPRCDSGLDGAAHAFDVAARRYFVLHQRANKGLMDWSALNKDETDEITLIHGLLQSAAECTPSKNILGLLSFHGRGTPKNSKAAIRFLRESSESGSLTATFNLALVVQATGGDALPHFRAAAEQGHPGAMLAMAELCEGAEDRAEARRWVRLSAEHAFAPALVAEGRCCMREKDEAAAASWFQRAT